MPTAMSSAATIDPVIRPHSRAVTSSLAPSAAKTRPKDRTAAIPTTQAITSTARCADVGGRSAPADSAGTGSGVHATRAVARVARAASSRPRRRQEERLRKPPRRIPRPRRV